MKKSGILNKDISEVIARMGHMDYLTICDAGLPIPESVQRIDLAVIPGVPSFLTVVEAVSMELQVETIILAVELKKLNSSFGKDIIKIFPESEISYLSHKDFKKHSEKSKAIIRTGEFTPYANVILISGVCF